MSGNLVSITTAAAEVALSAATAKTVLQVKTTGGTNHSRALLKKLSVMFDGTNTIAEPVVIKLTRQTTDGTGTTVTPVSVNGVADTILATAAYNFSAEPTASDVIDVYEVHPQAGLMMIFPLGLEPVIPANARLGIVVTAPAAVNCHASMWVEE